MKNKFKNYKLIMEKGYRLIVIPFLRKNPMSIRNYFVLLSQV